MPVTLGLSHSYTYSPQGETFLTVWTGPSGLRFPQTVRYTLQKLILPNLHIHKQQYLQPANLHINMYYKCAPTVAHLRYTHLHNIPQMCSKYANQCATNVLPQWYICGANLHNWNRSKCAANILQICCKCTTFALLHKLSFVVHPWYI